MEQPITDLETNRAAMLDESRVSRGLLFFNLTGGKTLCLSFKKRIVIVVITLRLQKALSISLFISSAMALWEILP